jgi:hypothetical protein
MCGYGWNDKGISGRIFEWLESRLENRLILLHPNPEKLKHSKSAMWHKFDQLFASGRLVLIKSWLSNTNYDDIKDYLS